MSTNKKKTERKSERRTAEKKQIHKKSVYSVFTTPEDVQTIACQICGATYGQHCSIKHYPHVTPKAGVVNVLGLVCTCPQCAPRRRSSEKV